MSMSSTKSSDSEPSRSGWQGLVTPDEYSSSSDETFLLPISIIGSRLEKSSSSLSAAVKK